MKELMTNVFPPSLSKNNIQAEKLSSIINKEVM